MTYTIKQGDTLSKIASANGLTLAELLDANPQFKANPNNIKVGDTLNIPGKQGQPPTQPSAQPKPQSAGRALGALSSKYETGGKGPGTVSSGAGDFGGVSYGSYQMSSKLGVAGKFVSQPDFPFRNDFNGLIPGSDQFTAKWKEIAAAQAQAFQESQHEYIKRTHFDPLVAKIKTDDGVDITTRGQALQDVVWSTAVQHGPNNSIVHKAIGALSIKADNPEFDKSLITAIYAERGRRNQDGNLVYFSKNSPAVQKGVADRFKNEEIDALNLLKSDSIV